MMSNGNYVASFIILSYNQKDFIEKAILSALNQKTFYKFEVIVADDHSVDGTWDIICKMASIYNFKYTRTSVNSGVVNNLNNGFRLAQGDFIFLMGGDDISHSDRVSIVLECFNHNVDTFCVYSNTFDMNSEGHVLAKDSSGFRYHQRNGEMTVDSFLRGDLGVLGCSAAYHRRVFDSFGSLYQGLPSEDKVLTLRSLMLGRVSYICNELVFYRLGVGLSNNMSMRSKDSYFKLMNGKLKTYNGYLHDGVGEQLSVRQAILIRRYIVFYTLVLSLLVKFNFCKAFKLFFCRVSFREKARFLFYYLMS